MGSFSYGNGNCALMLRNSPVSFLSSKALVALVAGLCLSFPRF